MPFRDQCLYKNKAEKVPYRARTVDIPIRYDDAVLTDMVRVKTEVFEYASNNCYKVERRFATMVRNHGLRRCRYLRVRGAKIHITMANMACNIIRMVNLLLQPSIAMPQN